MTTEKVNAESWDLKGQQHLYSPWGKVRLLVSPSDKDPSPSCSPMQRDGKCCWTLRQEWRKGVLQDWPPKLAPHHLASHGSFQPSDSCLFMGNSLWGLMYFSLRRNMAGYLNYIAGGLGKIGSGHGAKTSSVVLTISICTLGNYLSVILSSFVEWVGFKKSLSSITASKSEDSAPPQKAHFCCVFYKRHGINPQNNKRSSSCCHLWNWFSYWLLLQTFIHIQQIKIYIKGKLYFYLLYDYHHCNCWFLPKAL